MKYRIIGKEGNYRILRTEIPRTYVNDAIFKTRQAAQKHLDILKAMGWDE